MIENPTIITEADIFHLRKDMNKGTGVSYSEHLMKRNVKSV